MKSIVYLVPMDPSKFYKPQLSLLIFYGLKLSYQNSWKDFSLKLYAISSFFMLNVAIIFFLYNVTIGQPTVEVFSESFACLIVSIEATIKMVVFYLWSHKFQKLLDIMTELLETGKSMDEKRFGEISEIGNRLLKIYFTLGTVTTSGYLFGALYRNIFESERVLAFKGR